ncbi:Periplasmic beta-glucosidase precursor [Pirellulimonas nuda]|uniref:beta-glucosidase n=1 Tax=Pirellulimonas nuda TaxID=2528009 RepID=A0A518D915_9BACT|nr:glycoside hydrolase family 3 N-terminal domain-containing protein [Pirellulimonas nuda]QDU87971.1 Periplasmic beta-glucosidase precursor [Pirellulimonas nuda]
MIDPRRIDGPNHRPLESHVTYESQVTPLNDSLMANQQYNRSRSVRRVPGRMRRTCLPVLACLTLAVTQPPYVGADDSRVVDFTRYDGEVNPLLQRMTLAEKVGQMTQADLGGLKDFRDIATLSLGSVLSGGDADPAEGNAREAWDDTYQQCQRQAMASHLGVPILYGVDAVHGHNNVLGGVIFPHNIGLGCANDPDLVEQIARLTALEVRATGIQWTFAPCITIPRDDRWGRTYEGYSEDPRRVAELGAAAVRGLQGGDLRSPTSVLACAKHFVGDGGTSALVGPSRFRKGLGLTLDQGDTRCDEATLRRIHVAPYPPCIAEGVGTIMPSYSSWNGVKCTMHHPLLTDLLKEELGFDGFLISDYDAIDQCHSDYKTAIGLSINAGIDMAMVSKRYKQYIRLLTELVEEGTVPMARIDDAVRRILRVKASMGLLEADYSPQTDPALVAEFGSSQRRSVARDAVRKSLVLIKNNGVLPIRDSVRHVRVAGAKADDMGVQCGGWTIDWQGRKGEVTPGGTTLLQGVREVATGVEVTHTVDGRGVEGAEVVIVVVGEAPYAEGVGDDAELGLPLEDLALIAEAQKSSAPMVLVLLSGRPIALDDEVIAGADAIVAAWLPGTEGAGVADILFGAASPTGTLSFTWPHSADQHPINVGDEKYQPRFPFGHGLRYPAPRSTQREATTPIRE